MLELLKLVKAKIKEDRRVGVEHKQDPEGDSNVRIYKQGNHQNSTTFSLSLG